VPRPSSSCPLILWVSEENPSRQPGEKRHPATTSPRRFLANQIPALRFHALLNNEEAPEVNLMLA
jgi:hypothetical protein